MKKISFFIYFLTAILFYTPSIHSEEEIADAVQTMVATAETELETKVFNLINQNRTANFLPPLSLASAITTQARNHSINMANKVVPFGHQGVETRYANLKNAIPSMRRFGENVAYNQGYQDPARQAVSGWLRSAGHRANIMGDFNLTGIGVASNSNGQYYFTQIFVKASTSSLGVVDLEMIEESFSLPSEQVELLCDPCLIESAE